MSHLPPSLPTVRLPAVIDNGDGDDGQVIDVLSDLPATSKFGFEYRDPPPSVSQLVQERPLSLDSSESDRSDADSDDQADDPPQHEQLSESQTSTPTNRLNSDVDPLEATAPTLPRLSRAFSMPVASQLGHLKNPRRLASSSSSYWEAPSPVMQLSSEVSHLQEISLELADSVQMFIQTLLQLSPPQVLDPAKEQFSACSVSIPTPSLSAMFTSMKNLNYMSANMYAFSSLTGTPSSTGLASPAMSDCSGVTMVESDFDIGELLQSAGDAVSGVAAEAGVDVVLYHGDVGMRHVAVKGDECGVSYALTHMVRQVIATAQRGDSLEIGLFVSSVAEDAAVSASIPEDDAFPAKSSAAGRFKITFDVAHKFVQEPTSAAEAESASRPNSPASRTRVMPHLDSVVLRSLLAHLHATLSPDLPPKLFSQGRAWELSLVLERGDPASSNPSVVVDQEEPGHSAHSHVRIASEPTLDELTQFAETLKGKKVTLYASSKGSFAHHLTSYLTAWGLDVSHVSQETGEGIAEVDESSPAAADPQRSPSTPGPLLGAHGAHMTPPLGHGVEGLTPQLPVDSPMPGKSPSSAATSPGAAPLSFIFIDDNVGVLRERLRKLRSEQHYGGMHLGVRKRPSLAANHRPRSSPQVARALGLANSGYAPHAAASTVIVHFTSLSNYKLVKDAIQAVLTPSSTASARVPEVIVIPKPAGPRRFLTALHTAVTKPIVDPFFAPIATSPMSPGLHAQAQYFPLHHGGQRTPGSPHARPVPGAGPPQPTSRTNSDRSAATRSPKDGGASSVGPEGAPLPLPSPLSMGDGTGMEYFADAAATLGGVPSTGLVMQSPDGQPVGIFFQPKARAGFTLPSGNVLIDPGRATASERAWAARRRTSDPHVGPHVGTPNTSRRPSAIVEEALSPDGNGNGPSASASAGRTKKTRPPNVGAPASTPAPATPVPEPSPDAPVAMTPSASVGSGRRGDLARKPTAITPGGRMATPPLSPHPDSAGNTPGAAPRRTRRKQPVATPPPAPPVPVAPPKKGKLIGIGDGTIVPPISVLVVDDNPINQTILSTFMRKKKIKYDVAKNGEEAVQKWRSGGFHLILMDIQMPVMDGIQATKEIRRMEKLFGSAGPGTPLNDLGPTTPSEAASTDSKNTNTPYRSSVIIVALTASSLQSDRVAALAAGCNDFLTKPVSLEWLNNKIMEWGSIKALQMWADLRPEVQKSIASGQAAQAQHVARKLHVPEGRASPSGGPSRASSLSKSKEPSRSGLSPTRDIRSGSAESNMSDASSRAPLDDSPPSSARPFASALNPPPAPAPAHAPAPPSLFEPQFKAAFEASAALGAQGQPASSIPLGESPASVPIFVTEATPVASVNVGGSAKREGDEFPLPAVDEGALDTPTDSAPLRTPSDEMTPTSEEPGKANADALLHAEAVADNGPLPVAAGAPSEVHTPDTPPSASADPAPVELAAPVPVQATLSMPGGVAFEDPPETHPSGSGD